MKRGPFDLAISDCISAIVIEASQCFFFLFQIANFGNVWLVATKKLSKACPN